MTEFSANDLIRVVTMVASVAASIPILFYRCQGRFKPSVSLIAWALAFFMLAQAISAAFVADAAPGFYQAGITTLLAFLVWRSRGNVARLLRCD